MAAYRILKDMPELLEQYSSTELKDSIDFGIKLMTTPNKKVVEAIHTYEDFSFVHSLSDVTGFGLAGHTKEMLQNSSLSAIIETIPSIRLSEQLSHELGYAFDDCLSHETAGGMLIAVDEKKVDDFRNTLAAQKIANWIVGTIDKKRPGEVRVSPEAEVIEVEKI
jgi:selenide,water dikinase